MAKVLNFGTIILNIKVNIKKERNTEKAYTPGKMGPNTLEIGMKIGSMVKVNIHGTMADNMKVIGKIITWTAMASIRGKMAENTKEIT